MRSAADEYRRTFRGQAEEFGRAWSTFTAALLDALGVARLAAWLAARGRR